MKKIPKRRKVGRANKVSNENPKKAKLKKSGTIRRKPGKKGLIAKVTERKRIEESLKKSEEKYRNLVENINEVIYSSDGKGTITYISPAVESVMGYMPSEMIGRRLFDFVCKEDLPRMREHFEKILAGEAEPGEYEILTKSGETRWIRTSIKPVLDEGRVIGLQGVFTDITDHKTAEDKIKHSKNELEFLNDLMSHDLTNINQISLGYLELLGETALSESQRKYLANALYSTRRNARLIENVKRIWQSKETPLHPMDLKGCIEDAIREIVVSPQKNLKMNYVPQECIVLANELLKDVIINLLDNAVKFNSSAEIIVDVTVTDMGDRWKLSIADRGKGIPDSFKKLIFSRLERLEKGVRGSGLGLHLVKTIVESYKGDVWVEDRLEDGLPKGSIFNVLLMKVGQ